jgi:hypothetical protein
MAYFKKFELICVVITVCIIVTGCVASVVKPTIITDKASSNAKSSSSAQNVLSKSNSHLSTSSESVSSQTGSISSIISKTNSTNKNVYKNIIEMSTEKQIYPLDTQEINIIITNNTLNEANYGVRYTLEILKENKWNTVNFKSDTHFIMIAIILKSGVTNTDKIPLNILEKSLEKGKYRISKDVYVNSDGLKAVSAEFEIQ